MNDQTIGALIVVALLALTGCAGVGANNLESAVTDMEAGIAKLEEAYDLVSKDPDLPKAATDLALAYADFDKAYHDLIGNPEESCSSRCHHECSGADVVGCLAGCVEGHACEPHCCGCKDGTTSCYKCPAQCGDGDKDCAVLPQP